MKAVLGIVLIALLVAAAGLIVMDRQAIGRLRAENETLRKTLATTEAAYEQLAGTAQGEAAELARLRAEAEQLPKLRGELARLRAGSNELAQLQQAQQKLAAENQQLRASAQAASAAPAADSTVQDTPTLPGYLPRENWAFAGYATADASFNSMVWAMREGNVEAFLNAMSPEAQEEFRKRGERDNKTPEQMAADLQAESTRMTGFHLNRAQPQPDGSVHLNVQMESLRSDGTKRQRIETMIFRQVGNEWKFSPRGPP